MCRGQSQDSCPGEQRAVFHLADSAHQVTVALKTSLWKRKNCCPGGGRDNPRTGRETLPGATEVASQWHQLSRVNHGLLRVCLASRGWDSDCTAMVATNTLREGLESRVTLAHCL